MKIYTRTGDQGQSALFGGSRVPKTHPLLEAYGTVDELNSWLGLCSCEAQLNKLTQTLLPDFERLQNQLFNIGSHLALGDEKLRAKLPAINTEMIKWLEDKIDFMTEKLPALQAFILPGGSRLSAEIHIARTVARRAERSAVEASSEHPVDPIILTFLNRMSDYLFVLARYTNSLLGQTDRPWNK